MAPKISIEAFKAFAGYFGGHKVGRNVLGRVTDDGENGDLIYPESIVQIAAVLRPPLRPPTQATYFKPKTTLQTSHHVLHM